MSASLTACGLALPPVDFITCPTNQPNMPGFILTCSALSGLAAITASTALSIAPASVTWRKPCASTSARGSAPTIVGEQPREEVLGDLAGDDAFADEIDEARQRRRTQARVRHCDALRIGLRGKVAHQPVGDCLRIALDAAVLDGALKEIRRLPLGDEDRGVVGGEAVVRA